MKAALLNFARMEWREAKEQEIRKVRKPECSDEGSEAADGHLPSPQVSGEHSCWDQLPSGWISGNLSKDNANRKEGLMVSCTLCWVLYHMVSFHGFHNSRARDGISPIFQMKNWGQKRPGGLPKVTWLVSSRMGVKALKSIVFYISSPLQSDYFTHPVIQLAENL